MLAARAAARPPARHRGCWTAAAGRRSRTSPPASDERAGVRRGAQPADDLDGDWTVAGEPRHAAPARDAPTATAVTADGAVAWVPDAPGADVLVVVGAGRPAAGRGVVEAGADGVERRGAPALRRHALARPRDAERARRARVLERRRGQLADAWYLAQALIAAESLGTVEACARGSVAYAKERFTFGRAIGSYQAIKHALVGGPAPPGERALAAATTPAGRSSDARRVRARRRARRASVGGRGARLRRARADLRARRHRRDVGARRAAVLPPRAALAPPARRHRRRRRPRRRRAVRRAA